MTYRLLDPARGAAALAVVCLHTFAAIDNDPAQTHGSLLAVRDAAQAGCLGVDLFFVISGFCISSYTAGMVAKSTRARDFVRDRLLRIYPTFWAAYAVAILVALGSALVRRSSLETAISHDPAQIITNLLLVDTYFGFPAALDVTWTLIFEVAFYLLAACGFLLYRQGVPIWLLALASGTAVGLGLTGFHSGPFRVFEMLPEFACGALVYQILNRASGSWLRNLALWLALIAIPAASWLFYPRDVSPMATTPGKFPIHEGPDAICWRITSAAVFAVVLIAIHRWDEKWSDVPWLRWLGRVGAMSYSLYLIHMLVAGRAVNVLKRVFPEPSLAQWLLPVAGVTVSLAAGALLFRFVEAPMERWRRALARARREQTAVPAQN